MIDDRIDIEHSNLNTKHETDKLIVTKDESMKDENLMNASILKFKVR